MFIKKVLLNYKNSVAQLTQLKKKPFNIYFLLNFYLKNKNLKKPKTKKLKNLIFPPQKKRSTTS